jgi:membrane protease subunit HflC
MKKPFIIILALVVGITLYNSLYILNQTQQALVLRLGRAVDVVTDPGLKTKIPFVENILVYDKRILHINISFTPEEVIAADRKRVIVDAFAKYKITNPLKFYEKVGNETLLVTRLNPILEATLREEVGKVSLQDLLTGSRAGVMESIRKSANLNASKFGIDVVDVRIRRTDLPQENSNAIYSRMQTSHEKEARQTRAQGAEQAQIITARADRDSKVILAEAEKQAQIIRGEGDSEATRIFAEASGKDQNFFAFYRTMQAYRKTLNKSDTTMVLSPDSEFLKYFKNLETKP